MVLLLLVLVSCAALRAVRTDARETLPSSASAVAVAARHAPRLLDTLVRAEAFRGPVPLLRASGSVSAGVSRGLLAQRSPLVVDRGRRIRMEDAGRASRSQKLVDSGEAATLDEALA